MKHMTPIRHVMQLRGVSIRELAGLSGESTALICYITQGLAHFPTYEKLERVARYMGCTPSDLYTKAELRMMYPEQFPKRKREKDGNPRIRLDKPVYDYLLSKFGQKENVNGFVYLAVREEMAKAGITYADIYGGTNDAAGA